jgi:hypothetical protein
MTAIDHSDHARCGECAEWPAIPADEWEYAIQDGAGLHAWPFGPQDEELTDTFDACVKSLDGNDPDFWNPDDHIVRRRKAGDWEEVPS